MITRKIPKDMGKYETQIIGPFSARQIICYTPGLALAALIGAGFYGTLGDVAVFAAVVVAMPFLLFGAWKPYGLPLEKFLKTAAITMLLEPTTRKYITENQYARFMPEHDAPRNARPYFISKNPDCKPVDAITDKKNRKA